MQTLVLDKAYDCKLLDTKQIDESHYITNVLIVDADHTFEEIVKHYRNKDARYNLFGTILDMYMEHYPEQIQIRISKNYNEDGFRAEIHHFGPIDF